MELPFSPHLLGRAYGVRIEGAQEFLVSDLQVNEGKTATPFKPSMPCEVALSANSSTRVHFDDQPATFDYCVMGNPAGAKLEVRVVTLYGEKRIDAPLKETPPGDAALQKGSLSYDVFPTRPYGPWRIEARVVKDGVALSPFNELVLYRLHRPHYWEKDAPDSPFGTHTLSTTRHILMAKSAGVNWTRLHDAGTEYIGWYYLEPQPGKWAFRDADIARYRAHGMKILGAISTAPPWASLLDSPTHGYFDKFFQPKDYDAWANYAKVVVQHYAKQIDTYEIWNEPWGNEFWIARFDPTKKEGHDGLVTSKDPSADYAHLMQVAYTAVKAAQPEIKIVGINTSTEENGSNWTRGVLKHDGLNNCDIISYHDYTNGFAGGPKDVAEQGYQAAIGPILAQAPGGKLPKPVWMSEGSSTASSIGSGFYHYTVPYLNEEDVTSTSDRLCRFVIAILAQGPEKVFLYSMHSHDYFGARDEWRTLVTEDGYLHPCAAAHSAMAWYLEDTKFKQQQTLARGVTAYIFEGKDRAVLVLSPAADHDNYFLPTSKEVETVDLFGNPLTAGTPLGSTLIYITAKSAADLQTALKLVPSDAPRK